MGFTSTTYPSLQEKVEARISRDMTQKDDISKDEEDTIVSDVLDDLLQDTPTPPPKDIVPPPRAVGSGENRAEGSNLPGSWN